MFSTDMDLGNVVFFIYAILILKKELRKMKDLLTQFEVLKKNIRTLTKNRIQMVRHLKEKEI